MAIGYSLLNQILNFYRLDLFKDCKKVLDMGDQDINVDYDDLKYLLNTLNIKFNENDIKLAKNYPSRPRIASSRIWELLDFAQTDCIDIIELERAENYKNRKIIKHDLNYKFEISEKYDLVTDFGNNEHPFNTFEAYNTMHNLLNKNGLLWIVQEVYNGNGYYNFDQAFFESIAFANNYEVINSSYSLSVKHNEEYYIPCNKEILEIINFAKIKSIGISYILKKTTEDDFKIPYQSQGREKTKKLEGKEVYKLASKIYKANFLSHNYIPAEIKLSGKQLLSLIFKKILEKLGIK